MISKTNFFFVIVVTLWVWIIAVSCAEEGSIGDIFKKAEDLTAIAYTSNTHTVSKSSGEIHTVRKVWKTKGFSRVESDIVGIPGRKKIEIIRPEGRYVFRPDQKTYSTSRNIYGPTDLSEEFSLSVFIDNPNLKIFGEEDLDGKRATVFSAFSRRNQIESTKKIWIWNERGVPLKSESAVISSDPNINPFVKSEITVTYEYHSFEDIPMDVFDIKKYLREYELIEPKNTGTISSPVRTIKFTAEDSIEHKNRSVNQEFWGGTP